MLGVEQDIAPATGATSKRKHLMSTAMKRTSEWIYSQDIPSDITVLAGETTFNLHKFSLVSKCGYFRRSISEGNDSDTSFLKIPDIPGGAEAFEYAIKFCYGINFEINAQNVAMLRCVAEFLEMTEEHGDGNLVSRTEAYLAEVALMTLSAAVEVLHKAENLLPMSEKVKLISRCIDAVAFLACNDHQFSLSLDSQDSLSSSLTNPRAIVEWWAEELTVLRVDTFQRLLMAMKARGFKQVALGPILMLYVQKALRGLDLFGMTRKQIEPKQEHEKRVVLETIVSLLPREKNALSVSFLSMLLRAAIYLETTVACRLDLEKRMSLQLGQAVLDDLLIPSFSFDGDAVFDVDTVQRILMNYLEIEVEGGRAGYITDDEYVSPPPTDMDQVGRLMESYLAEIASDPNLTVTKFISFSELIPEQARFTEDGMYRAIDIYLKVPHTSNFSQPLPQYYLVRRKAHQSLNDGERKKVCKLMDCQKLSREACAHAAQNERLPVQIVVQVLHHEQQRFRNAKSGSYFGGDSPALSQKLSLYDTSYPHQPDELLRLRQENADLKVELLRMQAQGKVVKPSGIPSAEKPPLPKKSFMSSVSKKLGKLYPFGRSETVKPSPRIPKPPKSRRHSIS